MYAQTLSAKLVDTSSLTSTTAEAWTVSPEPAPLPSHFALFVCTDDVKDVAVDASTNKVTDHANINMDIVTVVEEILHEDGIKTMNDIVDLAEGVANEAFGKAMAENDDGHAADKEIVTTADENVVE